MKSSTTGRWTIAAQAYTQRGRTGWILQAQTEQGETRYSEVVLSEHRATESAPQAQAYLKTLQQQNWDQHHWPEPPAPLRACRAGLELLKFICTEALRPLCDIECSHLISMELSPEATHKALRARHAKVKIGQGQLKEEQNWVRDLSLKLHEQGGILKLDANGYLTLQETLSWLRFLEKLPNIAYLEQPLPVGQESTLHTLSLDTCIALALDESLTAPEGLQRALDSQWPGILAFKPMLLGIGTLPLEDENVMQRVVFSCAWETTVGLKAWTQWAQTRSQPFPLGLMDPCFTPEGKAVPAPVRIKSTGF